MKKVLSIFSLLVISSLVFSQTSMEEYNYVTKGLKIQKESGLDMKLGYSIQVIDTLVIPRKTNYIDGMYSAEYIDANDGNMYIFSKMYKNVSNIKTFVCYVVEKAKYEIIMDPITYNTRIKTNQVFEYTCIPSSKSEDSVKEKLFKQMNKTEEGNTELFSSIFHFVLNNMSEY